MTVSAIKLKTIDKVSFPTHITKMFASSTEIDEENFKKPHRNAIDDLLNLY